MIYALEGGLGLGVDVWVYFTADPLLELLLLEFPLLVLFQFLLIEGDGLSFKVCLWMV